MSYIILLIANNYSVTFLSVRRVHVRWANFFTSFYTVSLYVAYHGETFISSINMHNDGVTVSLGYFSGENVKLTDRLVAPSLDEAGIVGALTSALPTFRLRCECKSTLDMLLAGIADAGGHC